MFQSPLTAIVLITFGVVYLIKPDLFQRGIWKKTAISQQVLTPEQNKIYMRVLGAIFILVGLAIIISCFL